MRTRRGTREFHNYLAMIEPEVAAFIAASQGNFILHRGAVVSLVNCAVVPESFLRHPPCRDEFAKLYCRLPDFVPAFILFVRKQFSRTGARHKIQRWLVENLNSKLTAEEVAKAARVTKANDEDVRTAESLLRKRLNAPRRNYFPARDAVVPRTHPFFKDFSATHLHKPASLRRIRSLHAAIRKLEKSPRHT